jgi:hypothetical protein
MENITPQQKADISRKRFKKLASLRTNAVLRRLKVLGNCANRHNYQYTEDEVNKIFTEIERKLKEVKAKFSFTKEGEFKL